MVGVNVWDFRDWIRNQSGGVELKEMDEEEAMSGAANSRGASTLILQLLTKLLHYSCSI